MPVLTFPQIETDRLLLRAPGVADQSAILSFLGSDRAVFYGGPMGPTAAWQKFAAYVGQWVLRGYGMYAVVLKQSGDTIGMAGPHHPEGFDEPEMSWLLTAAEYEGHGYAFEASQAVLADLLGRRGWQSVVSYIDTANTDSRALAVRLGAVVDQSSPSPLPGCDTYRHGAGSDSDGSVEAYA